MHKLHGPALLGFSDFFANYDDTGLADYQTEIGKAVVKPKSGAGKGPVKVTPYKPARTKIFGHHVSVLKKAREILHHGAKRVGHAQLALSHKPAAVAKTVPAAKLAGRTVHLGADVAKKMSPKAQRAVQIHNDAVAKAKKATQVLAHHAIKAKKVVHELAKKVVLQKKVSKKLRTPPSKRGGVHVGDMLADPVIGDQVAEMLGEYYEAIGADPDPNKPGFLTDGSPDPAASTAPTTDSSADAGVLTDDPIDDGTAALGAPPDMNLFIADGLAMGGIPYDESKGRPSGFAGSIGIMTKSTDDYHTVGGSLHDGTSHYGYVWGSFDREGIPNGIMYGGQGKENAWNHFHGREEGPGSSGWHDVVELTEVASGRDKMSTNGKLYGPVVGNPGMKDFAAMRMDGNGLLFWLPQEAPDWLLFPIKQAAALTAKKAAEAEAAQKKLEAATAAKLAADNAAAQAAQEAANALAESAAASTAKIAKGEEETKQAAETTKQQAAETEGQQALVKQQAADTEAQAIESEQTKQAGMIMLARAQEQAAQDKQVADMLIAQAKQEQAYYAAHPEERVASAVEEDEDQQMAEGEPPLPGMDSGGSEGSYDDGAPLPGGDLMDDADGENFSE